MCCQHNQESYSSGQQNSTGTVEIAEAHHVHHIHIGCGFGCQVV